jgi:hypothetical protein
MSKAATRLGFSCVCLCVATLALCERSFAQNVQQRFQSEARLDAIFARSTAVQAGYGFSVPAGLYVRNGLVGGVGAGGHGVDGRIDILSRFSFDPFRENRWSPYAGAGFSTRFRSDRDGGTRGFLLAYLGVEGPLPLGERTGWVPAFEVGFGGGTRVGVILRRGIAARR